MTAFPAETPRFFKASSNGQIDGFGLFFNGMHHAYFFPPPGLCRRLLFLVEAGGGRDNA